MQGRPKRDPIDALITKIWFANASQVAGGKTPYWFWKEFGSRKGDKVNWERYKRGLRVPRLTGDFNPIVEVDLRFPGTARIFFSPIRAILKGSWISSDQAQRAIADLGDPFKKILLEGGYPADKEEKSSPRELEQVFEELSFFPSLELMEANILLLAWANDLANLNLWNDACHFYRFMIPKLIEVGNIPFHEELFAAADQIAKFREFRSANMRRDIFQSWREDRPDEVIQRERVDAQMREYFDELGSAHRER